MRFLEINDKASSEACIKTRQKLNNRGGKVKQVHGDSVITIEPQTIDTISCKKVKTSFCHDLIIYTKRDAPLPSNARRRRPFECKPLKSDGKLGFLQDVFFFDFRGLQTSK